MTKAQVYALVSSPERVAAHAFFPFLRYVSRWTKFAKPGEAAKIKERPIRYACRADSYIFSYYRSILAEKYEERLSELGLDGSVLAYRRVVDENDVGKCNIHFARDAFQTIRGMEDCYAIALDISSFFESLDHGLLRKAWCGLLDVMHLPPDHFNVFRAITQYAVADRDAVYEALGFLGPKYTAKDGSVIKGLLTSASSIPTRLCDPSTFRAKITPPGGSLIRKNRKPYGIPQGSPISDLLANIYLLDFDCAVKSYIEALGGKYFRYSDDILVLIPSISNDVELIEKWVRDQITRFGNKLKIKREKSAIFEYRSFAWGLGWSQCAGSQAKNGLEYLGFRFDGNVMYLRDSTLSNFQRKASMSAKRYARDLAKKHPMKSSSTILKDLNLSMFLQRYGRVRDFEEKADDVHNWTFWTYATRASKITGQMGTPIFRQLRNYRRTLRAHVARHLKKVVGI